MQDDEGFEAIEVGGHVARIQDVAERVLRETACVAMVDLSDDDQRLNCPLAPKLGLGDRRYARVWHDMQNHHCSTSEVQQSMSAATDYVDLVHATIVGVCDDMEVTPPNALAHACNLFGVPEGRIVLPMSLERIAMGATLVLFRLQSVLINHGTRYELQAHTEAGASIVEDSDVDRAAHAEMSAQIEGARKKLCEVMNMIDIASKILLTTSEMLNVMNPSWRTRMADSTAFVRSLMLAQQGGTTSDLANLIMHIVYTAHTRGLCKGDGMLWGHIVHNGMVTGAMERKSTLKEFVSRVVSMDNPAKWIVMMKAKIPHATLVREIDVGHTAMLPEMETAWGRYAFIGGAMDLIAWRFYFNNNADPRVQRLQLLCDYAVSRVSNERIRMQEVCRRLREDKDVANRRVRNARKDFDLPRLGKNAQRLEAALKTALETVVIPDEETGGDMEDEKLCSMAQYFFNDVEDALNYHGNLAPHTDVLKEVGSHVQAHVDAVEALQEAEAAMLTDAAVVDALKVKAGGSKDLHAAEVELRRLTTMLYVLEHLFAGEPMMDCELFIECSEFPYTQFARYLIPMTDDSGRLRFRLDCFRTPFFDQVFNYQGVGDDVLAFEHVFVGRTIHPPHVREWWDIIHSIYGLSSTGKTLVGGQHAAAHRDLKRGIDRVARISAGMQDTFGLSDQLKEGDMAARLIEFPDATYELVRTVPKTTFLKMAENEMIVAPKKHEQRAIACMPPHAIAFSNKKFPYPDTSGNIARRVAETHMSRPVRSPRTDMKDRIASNRIGAFIKGAGSYRDVTFNHQGKTFWHFCPSAFKREREKLENTNDPVKAFFGEMEDEGMLVFDPTAHIGLRELRTLSSAWTKNGRPRIRWNDSNLFASAFDVRKLRMVTKMADLNADDRAHIHEMNGAIVIGCKMGGDGSGS